MQVGNMKIVMINECAKVAHSPLGLQDDMGHRSSTWYFRLTNLDPSKQANLLSA